jgi:hypothetical protein
MERTVAHTDDGGRSALHWACRNGNLPTAKYLLEHGATTTERDSEGMAALLNAADSGNLDVVEYLLSSEGGASTSETDNAGNTALLLAAGIDCYLPMVQWLLEHGGAQSTDTNNEGDTVWTVQWDESLPDLLRRAYAKSDDGEYVFINGEYVGANEGTVALVSMLRVMVLHGGPPRSVGCRTGAAASADRARWRANEGAAPGVSNAKTGPLRSTLPAAAATPGPGARLRGAHHRRALGHGARSTPATR